MSGKIEISREMAADLTRKLVTHEDFSRRVTAREELRALLAAPVVERQPAGYVHQWELDRISKGQAHWAIFWSSNGANNPSRNGDPVALYAEQPAPVAVALPERRAVSEQSREQAMCANSWNACLDKVKELNQ